MGQKPMNMPQQSNWRHINDRNPSKLKQNLQILSTNFPELFNNLQPVYQQNNLYIQEPEQGLYQIKFNDKSTDELIYDGFILKPELNRVELSSKTLTPKPKTQLFFILGLDLGYSLQKLLPFIIQSPLSAFIVIEPDIQTAAASFAIHDMKPYLQSNRIRFVIGENYETQLEELFDHHNYFAVRDISIFLSSTANQPKYSNHWNTVRQITKSVQTQLQNQFQNEIQHVRTHYENKTNSPIRSMMALVQTEGMAVRYIQKRFLNECRQCDISIIDYTPGFANEVGILRAIHQFKPDCLLFINRSPGEYVNIEILNSIKLPRMIWCVDDPNSFLRDPFHTHDVVFTWDKSYNNDIKKNGTSQVDYFPYMADLDHETPKKRDEFVSPVSYIGQVKAFDPAELGLDDKTAAFVKHVGEEKYKQPKVSYQKLVLDHQCDFGLTLLEDENGIVPRFVRYGIYTIANALRRIAVLEAAMPFGLKLYGGEDWLTVLGDHPLRDCYIGLADPQLDVPDIFVSSTINLNIHSLQALTSLNQRDYNCPLVGGFLITDWVANADQFFVPDQEMIFYNNVDDLKTKIEYYLIHKDERISLIKAGKKRVLKEHTYAARVPGVIDTLNHRILKMNKNT